MGGKKEKVHLSTYDTNVIQLGNTNNKMATPAPVQLQLPLTVSGLVFLCICLWSLCKIRQWMQTVVLDTRAYIICNQLKLLIQHEVLISV